MTVCSSTSVCCADDDVVKVLALRRSDTCVSCGTALAIGTKAAWDATARTVQCLGCATGPVPGLEAPQPIAAPGIDVLPVVEAAPAPSATIPPQSRRAAGSSAQREYDKRSQRREAAIRSQHPRLGGLVLALTNEPASTRVWAQGAHGERAVAAKLDELAGEHLVALHDRRMLRPDGRASRANIDHLVVTAAGVWVIDAKTHQGTLQVRRSGGLFSPRVEKLFIAGRDKTSLLDGLEKQREAVRSVLAEVSADVPVRGVLCFVGTELPWFGENIGGVPLVGRRGLGKLLKQPGDLAPDDRDALAAYLDSRFIPA
jgi:hypothetical protein